MEQEIKNLDHIPRVCEAVDHLKAATGLLGAVCLEDFLAKEGQSFAESPFDPALQETISQALDGISITLNRLKGRSQALVDAERREDEEFEKLYGDDEEDCDD